MDYFSNGTALMLHLYNASHVRNGLLTLVMENLTLNYHAPLKLKVLYIYFISNRSLQGSSDCS